MVSQYVILHIYRTYDVAEDYDNYVVNILGVRGEYRDAENFRTWCIKEYDLSPNNVKVINV